MKKLLYLSIWATAISTSSLFSMETFRNKATVYLKNEIGNNVYTYDIDSIKPGEEYIFSPNLKLQHGFIKIKIYNSHREIYLQSSAITNIKSSAEFKIKVSIKLTKRAYALPIIEKLFFRNSVNGQWQPVNLSSAEKEL